MSRAGPTYRATVRPVAAPTIVLHGPRVLIRPGTDADAGVLFAIRAEPKVQRWWRTPEPVEQIALELRGEDVAEGVTQFVVEVSGDVVGLIQYNEETEPDYRHASIDVFLSTRVHGRGLGAEAVAVLAAYLVNERGHHRITIDPAAENTAAIRAYTKVGFQPVGLMRRYERDGEGSWRDGLLMDLMADELVHAGSTQHHERK
jgi:aminoglycoside 6'-N-acetyltransferase